MTPGTTKELEQGNRLPDYRYVLHLLQIKLWEFEGIAEKWHTEIMKHGPEQTMCEFEIEATNRVKEIKRAIRKIQEFEKYPITD